MEEEIVPTEFDFEDEDLPGQEEEEEELDEVEEAEEETPVEVGKVAMHGAGLIGSMIDVPGVFFVQVNKENVDESLNGSQVNVVLRPKINRMKLIGTGLKPPTEIPANVEMLPPGNTTVSFRVEFVSSFAANYTCSIQIPKANITETIPSLVIDSGPPHPDGCTLKGAGGKGGVSEMPSAFRLQIADKYLNPMKIGGHEIRVEFERNPDDPPCDKVVPVDITDQNDGSYTISYIAPLSGTYKMSILLNDEHIKGSPFTVRIVPGVAESLRKKNEAARLKREAANAKKPQPPTSNKVVINIPKKTKVDAKSAKYQNELPKIILLQCALRRFLAQKLLAKLAEKNRNRWSVAEEIVETEEAYITKLEQLNNFYFLPMQSQSFLTPEKVSLIFGNVVFVSQLNQDLLQALLVRTDQPKLPSVYFGDVFLNFVPQLRSAYSLYVRNYHAALKTISRLEMDPEYQQFIEEINILRKLDLMNLLIAPILRLPRYEMLLKELLKHTELESPDYEQVKRAIEEIRAINKLIDSEKGNAERSHRLMRIAKKVYNCPPTFDFFDIDSPRDYLGQGPLTVRFKKTNLIRQILLFDDSIIITRKKVSPLRGTKNLQFRLIFYFATMQVGLPDEHSIKLVDNGIRVVLFASKGSEKGNKWLRAIKEVVKRYQSITGRPQT